MDKVKKAGIGFLIGIAMVFLNYYLIPRFPSFSILVVIATTAFIVALVYQWYKQGSEIDEFWAFTVLTASTGFIGCAAAANIDSAMLFFVVILLPIAAIGYYALSGLKFHLDRAEDADLKKKLTGAMAAVTVVMLLALFGAGKFVFAASEYGMLGKQQEADITETAEASDEKTEEPEKKDSAPKTNWHFYNNDVQGGLEEDDFNFGPTPKATTAAEYDADFRERLENDPALGAADMAWADAWLGTRYLGEFYESCNKDWAKTINKAKEEWIKDPDAYKQTLDAFFQMLNTAEVKVTAGNGLEDQMYMNPYTVDDTPDVIVLATPDHNGKFLTYLFTIKGTGKVKVSYRVECGYQPTNVEEIMGITPQQKPSSPSNPSNPGKGDNPSNPSKPGKGDGPSGPQYNKDPNKAPKKNTEPNDDKGPGKNTNNPSNPNRSTEDTSDSSTSGSYDDYKKNVENLKDTNDNQKSGGDSNSPSTPAPSSNTNVDNNGDNGTGNGGIDKPTPKQDAETTKGDPAAGTMSAPS